MKEREGGGGASDLASRRFIPTPPSLSLSLSFSHNVDAVSQCQWRLFPHCNLSALSHLFARLRALVRVFYFERRRNCHFPMNDRHFQLDGP